MPLYPIRLFRLSTVSSYKRRSAHEFPRRSHQSGSTRTKLWSSITSTKTFQDLRRAENDDGTWDFNCQGWKSNDDDKKNRKLFYQSLDTHCSEIQDFVLKVYQQIGWAEFWNFEIRLGAMSFKILELGELWDGDLFNFMKYFFGYNFGFQNSVNVSYCVGDFNARWNLPKEQFDIISEKVNNRLLKIDFLGWSKSVLFSSRKVFFYRVSQKIATFQTKIF